MNRGEDLSTLPVTRTTLAELNVIGLNNNLELAHLTYLEIQQVLTLHSLLQLFADHGIQAPFHLAIEGLYQNGTTNPVDDF